MDSFGAALISDILWELGLIATVVCLSCFGLGALAYHFLWGRKLRDP